jgi:hypothetical protein
LAISWTLNGMPLTALACQTNHIDSMEVQILSDSDSTAYTEFENVVCALDRYSVAMIPSGPVTLYVNALRQLSSRSQCVVYAGTGQATAGSQFPQTPLLIPLSAGLNCP